MKNRAYSVLEVKSLDAEKRIIRGVATAPEIDRQGDIVDPMGVKAAADLPLLWQHRHDQPVGRVKFSKPTKDGIEFEAQLPFIEEEGALRDRVEEAWQSVKTGLVRAVSIGFRALDGGIELLKGGGVKFTKIEVYELSLVTIPACASAVITAIKNIDQEHLPASGQEVQQVASPGVSGSKPVANRDPVKLIPRKYK